VKTLVQVRRLVRAARSACLAAALSAAMLVPAGCGLFGASDANIAPQNAGPAGFPNLVESRIDAVAGKTLVIPLRVDPSERLPDLVEATLEGGKTIPAAVRWISIRVNALELGSWLPPSGSWKSVPASEASPGQGLFVLVLALPPDAAGQGITIGRRWIAVNWLPGPAVYAIANNVRFEPAPGADRLAADITRRLLEPEMRSPVRRWRYRLLVDGLNPAATPVSPDGVPLRFDDPVIEALAQQAEARWALAIARLAAADQPLARRLVMRLGAIAAFPECPAVPVWTVSQSELDTLLTDLLDPRRSAAQTAEVARTWLGSQPAAVAWLQDGSAERLAAAGALAGGAAAHVGVVNLLDKPVLVFASRDEAAGIGRGEQPELATLPPMTAQVLAVRRAEGDPASTVVHAGPWTRAIDLAGDVGAARPPGLRIEPFVSDWTLAAWQRGDASAIPRIAGAPLTRAVLYRKPVASLAGDQAQTGAAPTWAIFVECARALANDSAAGKGTESVRVWIGPRIRPIAVWRVEEDGKVVDEGRRSGPPREIRAVVRQISGGWAAEIELPLEAIEPGGYLRLAIERTDSPGARWTWPAPTLPWQVQPAHAEIRTTDWGIGAEGR